MLLRCGTGSFLSVLQPHMPACHAPLGRMHCGTWGAAWHGHASSGRRTHKLTMNAASKGAPDTPLRKGVQASRAPKQDAGKAGSKRAASTAAARHKGCRIKGHPQPVQQTPLNPADVSDATAGTKQPTPRPVVLQAVLGAGQDGAARIQPAALKQTLDRFTSDVKAPGAFIPLASMCNVAASLHSIKKQARASDPTGSVAAAAAGACDALAAHCAHEPSLATAGAVVWCRVLYSLAAAGTRGKAMDRLIARACALITEASWCEKGVRGQTLANLLWAVAVCKHSGDLRGLLDGAAAAITRGGLMRDAGARGWSLVLWSLASLPQAHKLGSTAAIVRAALPAEAAALAAGNGTPQDLSMTLWTLATMQWQWEEMAPIVHAALRGHEKYGSLTGGTMQAYSNAMWAVAAVWSPEEVPYLDPCIRDLALLCSVEIAKGLTHQGFMVQNLSNLMGAMASLQLTTPSMHVFAKAILDSYRGSDQASNSSKSSSSSSSQMLPVDLTCALWSCARLGLGMQQLPCSVAPDAAAIDMMGPVTAGPGGHEHSSQSAGAVMLQGGVGQVWLDHAQRQEQAAQELQTVKELIQALGSIAADMQSWPEQSISFLVYSIAAYAPAISLSCASDSEGQHVLAAWDLARKGLDVLASKPLGKLNAKGLVQVWLGVTELVELCDELQRSGSPLHASIAQAHISWLASKGDDPHMQAYLRAAAGNAISRRNLVTMSRSQQELVEALRALGAEIEGEAFLPAAALSPELQAVIDRLGLVDGQNAGVSVTGGRDSSQGGTVTKGKQEVVEEEEEQAGEQEAAASGASSGLDSDVSTTEAGHTLGADTSGRSDRSCKASGIMPPISGNKGLRTKRVQMDASTESLGGWEAAAGVRVDILVRALPGGCQLQQPVVIEFDGPDHFVEELDTPTSRLCLSPATGLEADRNINQASSGRKDGSVLKGPTGFKTKGERWADKQAAATAAAPSRRALDERAKDGVPCPQAARQLVCGLAGGASMSVRQLSRRAALQLRVPWWEWAALGDDDAAKLELAVQLVDRIRAQVQLG